ncbi:glutathione S-transferase [Leptospira perolatii]|uniref:Glutathione S-transferase n=1 Tax=Leptospira perolatii TaxID=2023191 RepID=A0A2M9ZMG2_9LEPT|nr:glutathione S-transferase family protein [Leptospira perolatii]PJZ68507.1 glutathione S-transferase [Leptospira perolatii]PJZ73204.1 glutathione S-transferase [Leptospira perolatii]
MVKLYGFPISNYTNKVKLALLEKGIEFEDVRVPYSQEEEFLQKSPMGKIPVLEVDGNFLIESQAILEFLEAAYPNTPKLFPSDPLRAAKVRSIQSVIENYVDSPARKVYNLLLDNKKPDPVLTQSTIVSLKRSTKALQKMVSFSPFIAGSEFTAADCTAFATFSVILDGFKDLQMENPLLELPGLTTYLEFLSTRPSVAKVEKARHTIMKALARVRK